MTAIADAELQRLLGVAISAHELWSARRYQIDARAYESGIEAFISALNARLEAAERMSHALEDNYHNAEGEWHFSECRSCAALAVYRKSKEGA